LRELSAVWHDKAAGDAALDALDRLSRDGTRPLMTGSRPIEEGTTKSGPLELKIEQLEFSHRGIGCPVFHKLDLSISPGEHVAVMGSSGAGKSTLLALMAGLCLPDGGTVCVIDASGAKLCPEAIRAGTGWVGQMPHIFSASLSANVSLKRPGIGQPEISAALDIARLGTVAKAQRHRPVGDGGSGISGGETLRLAVARAAANIHAGLILADEPTAHLDRGTAADITDSLLALAQGKTLVVATHDPVLAARMDRIIVLDREVQS
jgi:ATP-binding cassette subfamily C protein CydD